MESPKPSATYPPDGPCGTGLLDTGGFSTVNITPIAILNYYNAGFNGNENSVSVFPPTGGTTPIFTCTWAMLELCGFAGAEIPDRTGNYIFFATNQGGSELTKLDLNESKIVDLGISIPDYVEVFGLDDKLIYGGRKSYGNQFVMPIYVFDPGSGSITNRSEVPLPSPYSTPVPALRN